jgi:hypothetical protein
MNEQGPPIGDVETTLWRSGLWWTGSAVLLVALSHWLPAVWPTLFVEPTGQVGGSGFSVFGALVAAGLLYGARVARWVAIAYIGLSLFHAWDMLTMTDFRKTGWLVVAVLNIAALGILVFAPAVKSYFAGGETQGAEDAA